VRSQKAAVRVVSVASDHRFAAVCLIADLTLKIDLGEPQPETLRQAHAHVRVQSFIYIPDAPRLHPCQTVPHAVPRVWSAQCPGRLDVQNVIAARHSPAPSTLHTVLDHLAIG